MNAFGDCFVIIANPVTRQGLNQGFPTCGTRTTSGGTRVTSIFSQKPGFTAF